MKVPVTVNDLLDGQVGLDLECLDRIYLNGYVPTLQTSGQVASFLTVHLGNSIPSPALFEKIGTRFRADVRDHAAQIGAEWIVFRKGDRKLDVVRPLLDKAAKEGRSRGWWPSGWRRSSSTSPAPSRSTASPGRCRGSRSARPNVG